MHCSAIRQAETGRKPVCEPDFVKKEEAMRKSYEMDMCHGPLLRKLLVFSLPVMLSGVLQLLFNAADIIVVGQYVGSTALAAVGSTGSLINLLINLLIGLSVGANVMVARYYGAHEEKLVSQTVHTAILLSLVSGIVMIFIGIALAEPLLRLMGTPDNVLDQAALYVRILRVCPLLCCIILAVRFCGRLAIRNGPCIFCCWQGS